MTVSRLADRLSAARQRRFVGRNSEKTLFGSALDSQDLPFIILHIHGPGGIGKTSLIREFATLCEQRKIPAYYIDCRNVEASPEPFVEALRQAMSLNKDKNPLYELEARERRQVILLDTYETMIPLDGWLREIFLPQLPENIMLVIASRFPPARMWRDDAGWSALLRTLALRNLEPGESRDYLKKREIPADTVDQVLLFTHGHPLALSLVADVFAQRHEWRFDPQSEPDVVKALLERLVQKVPGPAHRTALEACALVRLTTESLLSAMLNLPDANELFEWLRTLSFIETGKQGLFPHDLAREALISDLRWRNPEWYAELHNRARQYYASRLQQVKEQEQQRLLYDYIYLHRDNPVLRPFLSFFPGIEVGAVVPDILREGDLPLILDMVRQHEGEKSAELAEFWLERQPQGTLVFRDSHQQALGFTLRLSLNEATPEDIEHDPAISIAWHYLQKNVPLRPGESAAYFRFWMAHDSYQAFSYIQSLIGVNVIRYYLVTPGLAFSFFPCAVPDDWELIFAYADLERMPEIDFKVGERTYGLFGHNWRATPPMAWLALLAERETQLGSSFTAPPKPTEALLVLSEPEFGSAVKDALRDYTRPDLLQKNPLLQSRLIIEKAGNNSSSADRANLLRNILKEAAEQMQNSPKESRFFRVLHHTYFSPASTQEQAAELLDLPFSTYRRHLKTGLQRVTSVLWQKELQGNSS